MSEILRYEPTKSIHDNGTGEDCECDSYAYCDIDDSGEYVKYTDYEASQQLNEQLQQRIKELEITVRLHEQLNRQNEYKLGVQERQLDNYMPLLERAGTTEFIVGRLVISIDQLLASGKPATAHHILNFMNSVLHECNKSSMVGKDNYSFISLKNKVEQIKSNNSAKGAMMRKHSCLYCGSKSDRYQIRSNIECHKYNDNVFTQKIYCADCDDEYQEVYTLNLIGVQEVE